MQKLQKKVVCLVEKGWEGTRKLTISLANEKISSLCIIKGKLEKEILEMITKYNGISLISIKRSVFKLYIFVMFLRNLILRDTACIVMDSRKSYQWVSALNKLLGIKTVVLIENYHDYTLFWNEKPQDIKFILNLAKGQK